MDEKKEFLLPGIHPFSIEQFIKSFCNSETRQIFIEPIEYIYRFAKQTGVQAIFVGGSFLTSKLNPNDIDFLVVYDKDNQIPKQDEMLALNDVRVDIMFCSSEDKEIVDSYLHLFSHDRHGVERGIVEIKINDSRSQFTLPHSVREERLDLIKNTYVGRRIIERNSHKGILISIHGLLSRAEWNFDIAPIASSNGWIFAPYVYVAPRKLLFSPKRRKNTIENFRIWIYDIAERYKNQTTNLSIVAHSYGTFITGNYLNGYDKLPVNINSIILTGSILNRNYNWKKHFDEFKVGRVLNIFSPNDKWVRLMLEKNYKKIIGMDTLFGKAGYSGFNTNHEYLFQRQLDILNHTNTIKRDIIETVWMPFLNNNSNSLLVNISTQNPNRQHS